MTCKLLKGRVNHQLFYVAIFLWIYLPKTTSEVRCGKPGRTPFSIITGSKETYQVGDEVHYNCTEEDLISGPSIRVCQSNSTWSGRIPECFKPVEIQNARLYPLIQRMNVGATIDGNSTTCVCTNQTEHDSFWEGYLPTSLDVRAVKIVFPGNMAVRIEAVVKAEHSPEKSCGNFSGNTARERSLEFRCPIGTVGKYVHIRNLFPSPPNFCICEVKVYLRRDPNCLQPDIPWHGNGYKKTSGQMSEYNFNCDPGYELWGDRSVHCLSDGTWTPQSPTCHASGCEKLPLIANGAIVGNFTAVGATASLVCLEGFRPISDTETRCLHTGKWSSLSLHCAIIRCEENPIIAHGVAIMLDNSQFYGSRLQIMCNRGYVANSSTIRMCDQSATWGDLDICIAVTCGNVEVAGNSYDKWLPFNGSNSIRFLNCPNDFHIDGSPPVMRCLINGSWSYSSATCKKTHWGNEWNPTIILTMAVAVGAGTAVCILCLTMSIVVIRRRRHSKTNTTVFHLGVRDSVLCNGGKKGPSLKQEQRYYPTDPYEDVIELRQKPASTQSRKPRSALPHLPLDADPVYAQPFETASDLKKVSTDTAVNRDDLYTAHIYAEPIDSRRPQSGTNNASNCVSETWFRTGTGKFGRKMSLPDCPTTPATTGQQSNVNSCAIYETSCHSSPLNNENSLPDENCQKTTAEKNDISNSLISNTIYLESSNRPRISLNQVQMISNDIYTDDYFSNA